MRSESWTILGSPAVVILPKVELLATLEPGALHALDDLLKLKFELLDLLTLEGLQFCKRPL